MTEREIEELIRFLMQTDVRELRIERENERIEIVRAVAGTLTDSAVATAPVRIETHAPAPSDAAGRDRAVDEDQMRVVSSPLVGTFFRCPAPGKPPFVEIGSVIEAGATLCIVESMKVMNEIESDVKGRVARVLVEDGQPVEYGQRLFLIEPIL